MHKIIFSQKELTFILFKAAVIIAVLIIFIRYCIPQHWAYFVRKPAPTFYNAYIIDKQIRPLINNNMSYGMGMSRKGRAYYKELEKLISNNKHLSWKPVPAVPFSNLLHTINCDTVYIDNAKNFFSGKLLIIRSQWPSDSIILNHTAAPPAKQYALAFIKVK